MQILNNISKITALEPESLSSASVFKARRAVFTTALSGVVLPLIGLARCEWSTAIEDKALIYTAKLTATLAADPSLANEKRVYLIETVKGDVYLVGGLGHPFPVTNVSAVMPDDPAEKSVYTLTVDYISADGVLAVNP